jgi:hypothetical protein
MNRRDFLGNSSAVIAATALGLTGAGKDSLGLSLCPFKRSR